MAENKKGFILYCDLIHTIEQLPNDKAGELFKHILRYVNDQNPITDDLITNITFEPIKQQLKRDLKQWEDSVSQKSISGKLGNLKRWNNDLYIQVLDKIITIEDAEVIANSRKISHPDKVQSHSVAKIAVTDTVTVTDIVIDTVIEENNISEIFNFKKSFLDLGVEKYILGDWIKVRKLKKCANTETAFKAIKKEIEKSKLSPNECIKKAVEKSWGGFEAEWLKNTTNNNTTNNANNRRDLSEIDHSTATKLADM